MGFSDHRCSRGGVKKTSAESDACGRREERITTKCNSKWKFIYIYTEEKMDLSLMDYNYNYDHSLKKLLSLHTLNYCAWVESLWVR
jgi:hypothetical protein